MTRERWGWILVALGAVLLGALTRAPAVSARVQRQMAALAHVVRTSPPVAN